MYNILNQSDQNMQEETKYAGRNKPDWSMLAINKGTKMWPVLADGLIPQHM